VELFEIAGPRHVLVLAVRHLLEQEFQQLRLLSSGSRVDSPSRPVPAPVPNDNRTEIEAALAALEGQRETLGDAVAELAMAPLRARLVALGGSRPLRSLRQVSVLFCDVAGSTRLGQSLDPEDIQALMDGALRRLTALVEHHHGQVLQYAGDNLLAVFGVERGLEDDAEHAVRAGLALLEEALAIGHEIERTHRLHGFGLRVGVHTGQVLLGGGVDEEGSIRGAMVNIAARMEQTAPVGGMRISHDTWRHVRGMFDVEAQPPLQVKGSDEPLATYLVLGARPRAFRVASRGIEGLETRMVGREAELATLQGAFSALYKRPALQLVTVVGEAGLGKSRLLFEFEAWANLQSEAFELLQGRAHPHSEQSPYGLLRDALARRLLIADNDTPTEMIEKFGRGIVPLLATDRSAEVADAQAAVLGHLLGLGFGDHAAVRVLGDDHARLKREALRTAVQVLRRLGAAQGLPVVMLLEDLHWADSGTLDFIQDIAAQHADAHLLIVGLTRPTLFERRPTFSVAGVRVELQPLAGTRGHELVDVLLQRMSSVPEALRELLIGDAQGNPFYMEELVKMFIDQGLIEIDGQAWHVRGAGVQRREVPGTLTGVLQARLDTLSPAEKRALQQASVIGPEFWDGALASIDAHAAESLPALARRELIQAREHSAFDGLREYVFGHHLMHQVTYEGVLKSERRAMHAQVASWLASLPGMPPLALIGDHFDRAGDTANACEYLTRAAETARLTADVAVMQGLAERAHALLAAEDMATRWRIAHLIERSAAQGQDGPRQRHWLGVMHDIAETVDDDDRRLDVALGWAFLNRHHAVEALRFSIRGQELASRLGPMQQQRALRVLGVSLLEHGDREQGMAALQKSRALARSLGSSALEIDVLNGISFDAWRRGDVAAGLQADLDGLTLLPRADRNRRLLHLNNLGAALTSVGAYEQARTHLLEAETIALSTGVALSVATIRTSLASVALELGAYEDAQHYAAAAVEVATASAQEMVECYGQAYLGHALAALGQVHKAADAYRRVVSLADSMRSPGIAAMGRAGLARLAAQAGDPAAALALVQSILDAIAAGARLDESEEAQRIRLTCWQVLSAASDARAPGVLAQAHAQLMQQADALTDATCRASYLNDVPYHRELQRAAAA